MPANYVLLERVTLTADAASVTFDNIPQTGYTDLVIKVSARGTQAAASNALTLRFNGSTTSYSGRELVADGSGVASATRGVFGSALYIGNIDGNSATSSTFGNAEIYIPNYTLSNNKSISIDSVSENNATESYTTLLAGLWADNAAITSVALISFASHGILMAGSSFSIYGVAKLGTTPVLAPKASGGDIVESDGTYWYHTFLNSSLFTPNQALTCDYLVVAGGAGGGSGNGGGGGAGGLRSTVTATGGGGSLESALSLLASTNYTVTIGAGGIGGLGSAGDISGTGGSNSVFATITSTGGGGGAAFNAVGFNGGSGGGGCGQSTTLTGGNGTTNQGFAGGAGNSGSNTGGGGGGAGTVGTAGSSAGGNGGNGVATAISGSSVTYAGGGGGGGRNSGTAGTGGTGGGGNGGTGSMPALGGSGTANTGSGGGGGGGVAGTGNGNGGNGGSGIVIVRYTVA